LYKDRQLYLIDFDLPQVWAVLFLLIYDFTGPYTSCFIKIFNMVFIAVLAESFTKC
jgi:hypothetical protein